MERKRKILFKYVAPSILSMLSVMLFTIIDGIFVGRGVGTDALGAVNIAFPFVMIFTAMVLLVTVGGLTITAIRIGRDDWDGANVSYVHTVVASAVVSAVFCFLGTVTVKQVAALMGSNATFFDMVCDYTFWYAVFMIPCGLYSAFNGFCRNDGDPLLVTISVVVSTTLNIFGDWLFVFPLHMGLKGAAIATGISQAAGLLVTLTHFIRKKGKLRFIRCRFDPALMKKIIVRGLPECVSQFAAPMELIFYNIVLLRDLGDRAENVFSVIGYVAAFAIAVFVGTAEGAQPLFGRSYGAKKEEDLKYYLRSSLIVSVVGSLIIYVALLFVGRPICSLYGLDELTLEATMEAMPKYSLGFLVQSVTVVLCSYLYSTTRTGQALMISILRSFVLNTIVIFAMPVLFGPESIWFAFPVFEGIAMVIAIIVTLYADRNGAIQGDNE